MNERLKELWDEAAKAVPANDWTNGRAFVEKLTELVVRECIKIGEEYSEDFYHFKDEILKHFGVE